MERFLHDKHILLTGSTGFVGKRITEKILREQPRLAKLYLLIRKGKGKVSAKERAMGDVFENGIFNRLKDDMGVRQFYKMVEDKVEVSDGDIGKDNFALPVSILTKLHGCLDYIIHNAATTDFQARLSVSLNLNTLATTRALDLADQCIKLRGVVLVSTAFVNAHRRDEYIYEKVCSLNMGPPDALIEKIRKMGDVESDAFLRERVIPVFGSSYLFTKALSEEVATHRAAKRIQSTSNTSTSNTTHNYCIDIVRPSIIISTHKGPVRGWLDGITAANGIAFYMGLGVLTTFPNSGVVVDLVPVDDLVNTTVKCLAVAKPPTADMVVNWARPNKQNGVSGNGGVSGGGTGGIGGDEIVVSGRDYPKVYHCSSPVSNPITLHDFCKHVLAGFKHLPPFKKKVYSEQAHFVDDEGAFQSKLFVDNQFYYSTMAFINSMDTAGPNERGSVERGKLLIKYRGKIDKLYNSFNGAFRLGSQTRNDRKRHLDQALLSQYGTMAKVLDFDFDIKDVDWANYVSAFVHGLYYWVMAYDAVRPTLPTTGGEVRIGKLSGHGLSTSRIEEASFQAAKVGFRFDIDIGALALLENTILGCCDYITTNKPTVNKGSGGGVIYRKQDQVSEFDYLLLVFVLNALDLPMPVASVSKAEIRSYRVTKEGVTVRKTKFCKDKVASYIKSGCALLWIDNPMCGDSLRDKVLAGHVEDRFARSYMPKKNRDIFTELVKEARKVGNDAQVVDVVLDYDNPLIGCDVGGQKLGRIFINLTSTSPSPSTSSSANVACLKHFNKTTKLETISIINIVAFILYSHLQNPTTNHSSSSCTIDYYLVRQLTLKLTVFFKALGYGVDWDATLEDSNSVIAEAIKLIGPNFITKQKDNIIVNAGDESVRRIFGMAKSVCRRVFLFSIFVASNSQHDYTFLTKLLSLEFATLTNDQISQSYEQVKAFLTTNGYITANDDGRVELGGDGADGELGSYFIRMLAFQLIPHIDLYWAGLSTLKTETSLTVAEMKGEVAALVSVLKKNKYIMSRFSVDAETVIAKAAQLGFVSITDGEVLTVGDGASDAHRLGYSVLTFKLRLVYGDDVPACFMSWDWLPRLLERAGEVGEVERLFE